MNDIVNGLFEVFGAPFILLSVLRLNKQKVASGVSWLHAGYFTRFVRESCGL